MFPLDKDFVVVFFFSVCIRKLETIVQTCVYLGLLTFLKNPPFQFV